MKQEFTKAEIAERSLLKTYRKRIWNPFIEGVKTYRLIEENDRVAVCISGGKDSMLLAKLLQILHRYTEIPFTLKFISMDPGYSKENRRKIEENANDLEIPVQFFKTDIFQSVSNIKKSPCYLCARMRRGHLYKIAQSSGCNKIALGHHFNDVIETTLMGMLYGGQIQGMLPKLHSQNYPGMELIRPLYCVHENNILAWKNYNHLSFLQCACKMTEQHFNEEGIAKSKRLETKLLIQELKKTNPNVEKNIFNSIQKVHTDTVIGYKSKGEYHHFLDTYNEEKEYGNLC